jgi:hypothetical protein
LKAWPLLSLPAAAGIRCSIPACPPCAGVHPWLKNEEEKARPKIALFEIARVLVRLDHRLHDARWPFTEYGGHKIKLDKLSRGI